MPPGWGIFPVLPMGPTLDVVVSWMHEGHVALWWDQAWPAAQWAEAIAAQRAGEHSRPWLITRRGQPFAYIEVYRSARDVVARTYPALAHDLGIHLALGARGDTGRGLGTALLRAVGDGLLAADPSCRQLVGDPDAKHEMARRAFAAAGFEPFGEVELPHKRAALLLRPRRAEGLYVREA
jgi:RimJ/RimL family protein N-acetyltransferase